VTRDVRTIRKQNDHYYRSNIFNDRLCSLPVALELPPDTEAGRITDFVSVNYDVVWNGHSGSFSDYMFARWVGRKIIASD